ncbi:MAG: type II secretion system protein N, partial [Gammaproteobacteria bacterium]
MRRTAVLVALGALLLLFFVIALWPARVAVGWLVPGGASLAGVSGTVWDGSAARVRVGIMDVGALKWEARPLSFLTGSPTWRLEASRPDGFARATVKILGAQSVAV